MYDGIGRYTAMMTIAECLTIDLPEHDWRAIDLPHGFALVRSPDYDACGGNIEQASFIVSIAVLRDRQPGSSIDALMRRRVPQGRPEESAVIVAGAAATRFEYFDGVRQIHSYFVRCPSGVTVEITLATFLHPTGQPKVELERAAPDVFSRLEWAAR